MKHQNPKTRETPPAVPPGNLYFEQKQEIRRAEPCRLKRPSPARAGALKLFRKAAFTAGLMLLIMLAAAKLVRLTARTKPSVASAGAAAPHAPATAPEQPSPPAVAEAEADPDLMRQAVLAVHEADAMIQSGSWSNAAALYRRTLDFWPGFAAAHAGLGRACLMLGDLPEAEASLKKAAAADPGSIAVLNDLGRLEMIRKNPAKASLYFSAAAHLKPEDIDSRLNLARSNFALGYVERARKHVKDALGIQPGNAEALRYLSYLEAAAGNYEESINVIAEAIRQAPDMASLYTDAAATCALMGNSAKAVDYLKAAVRLDSAEKIRLVFGEPVFLAARQTAEGRELERELAGLAIKEKETGQTAPKQADSPAVDLTVNAGKK